ncbi:hypothetical protein, partial [Moorena sp. SIO2C4]|uniref:hypothetical protein n=1 Tax=Moorena sp. SIO2C4 TaxID=2607824 RepID=UPI0013CAD88F
MRSHTGSQKSDVRSHRYANAYCFCKRDRILLLKRAMCDRTATRTHTGSVNAMCRKHRYAIAFLCA